MQPLFPYDAPASKAAPTLSHPGSNWERLKSKLATYLPAQIFEQWVAPIHPLTETTTELVLLMPNMVFYHSFVDEYLDILAQAKTNLGIDDLLIRFEVAEATPVTIRNEEAGTSTTSAEVEIIDSNAGQGFSRALSSRSQLNREYTFDAFVRGTSNQFAHATCMAVADAPGQTYNPLFIYGSTGLGKTHLLHAVGNRVLERNPNANICYISSERFMNEMVYCLRFNKMLDFRRKYRSCDVFLVDDIQFISGKDRTQEEFFHTFNTLYEAKKQIVITSDKFPQDISDIEDRLRNRFQWGLIADIQPPDVEHRMAILMTKADHLNVRLGEDVAFYIANHAKKNVRELEGALHRIAAFAGLKGKPIDLELAQETFHNVLSETPKRLTIETIQKTVADHFRVKISDLKSKKRQRAVSVPRQIAMYLSRTRTNASFPEIGDKFGGKDHTTVMHAVRKIEGELPQDLDLRSHVDALERRLEQM